MIGNAALRRIGLAMLLQSGAMCTEWRSLAADDAPAPIKRVKVKRVVSAQGAMPADAMPELMPIPAAVPVTLPAERLPQYRIGYQAADAELLAQLNEGKVRFLLTDPSMNEAVGHPLLVELTVFVDEQPLSAARQQWTLQQRTAATTAVATDSPENEPATSMPTLDESQESADSTEPKAEEVAPATEPEYRLTDEPQELMRRYAAAIGEPLDDVESLWLMNHWTEGPSLLVLQPYFQSFRAQQRPVFSLLDQDRNGELSKDELEAANAVFGRCDVNRDDIIDVLELSEMADQQRNEADTVDRPGPLLRLLSDIEGMNAEAAELYAPLAVYDRDQNGTIDSAEIKLLGEAAPDLQVTVAFSTSSVNDSRLDLMKIHPELQASVTDERSDGTIEVTIGSQSLLFSALQSEALARPSAQVAIGAVVDGYPLLPELDPNDDGRFTLRERRQLTERLLQKDRNHDRTLTRDECSSPIRVCIGLGPLVHQELAELRTVPQEPAPEAVSAPEWFVRMDRNQDNDLTRGEFPGTDEQFTTLDRDQDALVSAREAHDFETESGK